jgi:hypothetical protein
MTTKSASEKIRDLFTQMRKKDDHKHKRPVKHKYIERNIQTNEKERIKHIQLSKTSRLKKRE